MGEEDLALKTHIHTNYIDANKIANNLVTTDTGMVLAATMGTYINERLEAVKEMYRAYLNPGFFTLECTPSGGKYNYFCDSFPDKFYIKSLDEKYYMILNSNLDVLKQVGTATDIGVLSIPRYELYEVTFIYREEHGTVWWERSEHLIQSGRLIMATKKFKLMASYNYYYGNFDYLNGILQQCNEPTPPLGEYDNHYLLKVY